MLSSLRANDRVKVKVSMMEAHRPPPKELCHLDDRLAIVPDPPGFRQTQGSPGPGKHGREGSHRSNRSSALENTAASP